MAKLEALIFDVDGTLADTEAYHLKAFNETFFAHGMDWKWSHEDYLKLLKVTGGKERMAHFARDWRNENPDDYDIVSLHKEKTERYVAMLNDGKVSLRPGVERLFRETLDAGLKLGIATTTSTPNVTALIGHTLGQGVLDDLAVIAAGDCVARKKPAPDIYQYALNAMNLPADACIAFEDSAMGVRSSVGAGIRTLVTVNPFTEGQTFDGADVVLSTLGSPETPARHIAGRKVNYPMVTLEWLRETH